jgi:RNA methyltransferase, TrmH family
MSPQPLTSLQNPRVKLARGLTRKKEREKTGLFLVEGDKLFAEATAAGLQPVMVFALVSWWERHPFGSFGQDAYSVPESLLASIATTDTPTSVVAVFPQPRPEKPAESLLSLAVVAHQIQDPGNLGTIIRSADAAGADAVFITEGCTDPWSTKCVRASMGSCFHLPVVSMPLPEFCQSYPHTALYALTLSGAESLYQQDLRTQAVFLIGNEGAGLSQEAVSLAQKSLKIPIPGQAESLNAGMAATICLFEAVRQRQSTQT